MNIVNIANIVKYREYRECREYREQTGGLPSLCVHIPERGLPTTLSNPNHQTPGLRENGSEGAWIQML